MVSIVFSLDDLRKYSVKAGLGLQMVVKDAFLFEFMEIIDGHPFVLKGGTALNKGYIHGHQRFSEDLDYDTDLGKKEVNSIMESIDMPIKKRFHSRHAIGYQFSYSLGHIVDVVTVDVAFGTKGSHETVKMASDFLPVSKRVKSYPLESLVTQKEKAFLERREWKDLYDLYWVKNLFPARFSVSDKDALARILDGLKIPKYANSYIPLTKRLNWQAVIEDLKDSC